MAIVPTDVLFERYHSKLLADVSRVVPASPETLEDACSATWAIAARRAIREDTAYRWLCVVAVREAGRLHQRELRAHAEAGATLSVCRDQPDPAQDPHARAVWRDAFRRLRPRQREVPGLSLAGLDYREIGAATGDSYRTVDRQLVRARARLRRELAT